jgi:hypothetical protein
MDDIEIIEQTTKWIKDVVIASNFCPFAAREMKRNTIYYKVARTKGENPLDLFLKECSRLDSDKEIETTLLIFPDAFQNFDDYLDLVFQAEKLLKKKSYEGIYQVASFHPFYKFAGSTADDAANFTNRSPYPMLHLLREESIEKSLLRYPNPENIPENNIHFARKKGFAYMNMLRDSCLKS